MSHNYYSEINLHTVWHTKESLPLLTPRVEEVAYREFKRAITKRGGVFLHEIGGTATHVHLCVAIQPTVLISEWIGEVKGASSHEVNCAIGQGDKVLHWQTGYGVVSFGTANLDWVKEYVGNQKEHHANQAVYDRLERVTEFDDEAEAAAGEAP